MKASRWPVRSVSTSGCNIVVEAYYKPFEDGRKTQFSSAHHVKRPGQIFCSLAELPRKEEVVQAWLQQVLSAYERNDTERLGEMLDQAKSGARASYATPIMLRLCG